MMGFPWTASSMGGAGQGFLAFLIGDKVRFWDPYFVGEGGFASV